MKLEVKNNSLQITRLISQPSSRTIYPIFINNNWKIKKNIAANGGTNNSHIPLSFS